MNTLESIHTTNSTKPMQYYGNVFRKYDWTCKLRYSAAMIYPANKLRNKYVIITSKRRFDVIITYLLRSMFAGKAIVYWTRFFLCGLSDKKNQHTLQQNLLLSKTVFIHETTCQISQHH